MVIKSKNALKYREHFLDSVPEKYRDLNVGTLEDDLRLDIIVWYTSRRPDLSVELIKDNLEAAGVIKNDRYVREEHLYGFVDKENPRTKIQLYRITSDRKLPF
jgi:Holliday junction resolvase RusA-like endonuclease